MSAAVLLLLIWAATPTATAQLFCSPPRPASEAPRLPFVQRPLAADCLGTLAWTDCDDRALAAHERETARYLDALDRFAWQARDFAEDADRFAREARSYAACEARATAVR